MGLVLCWEKGLARATLVFTLHGGATIKLSELLPSREVVSWHTFLYGTLANTG